MPHRPFAFGQRLLTTPVGRALLLGSVLVTLVSLFSCKEVKTRQEVQEVQAPPPPAAVLGAPEIRVAVVRDAREVRVAASIGGIRVLNASGTQILQVPEGREAVFAPVAGGLALNGQVLNGAVRLVRIFESARLLTNGAEMSRQIDLYQDAARGGTLTAVAYIGLEEYLTGVLAGEVPYDRWGAEALKAQAITSRSYALFQMKLRANEPYDVESTVMSQVFKPGHRNNVVLNSAVNATRGLVLTSGGKLFPAYFHSTCGGSTVRGSAVFADSPAVSPLNGVACPYCTHSPSYRWTAAIARDEIARKLRAFPDCAGQNIGIITALDFLGATGLNPRAQTVRVRHANGEFTMHSNRFRLAVGPGVLKSVGLERAVPQGETFSFAGRGFGHGVGLCQYGSNGMSERGFTCEQILGFYFPGGELTKLYGDRATASR